jgi:hypothetical protein
MDEYWDQGRDIGTAREPDPRGAVFLLIVVAGVLAAWILDRAESLLGRVKRRPSDSTTA